MDIAYITRFDSIDIKNWSGTEYFIAKSLENNGAKLSYITHLKDDIDLCTRLKSKYSKFQNKKYLINRSPSVAKGYARQIQQRISKSTDIVFRPALFLLLIWILGFQKYFTPMQLSLRCWDITIGSTIYLRSQ